MGLYRVNGPGRLTLSAQAYFTTIKLESIRGHPYMTVTICEGSSFYNKKNVDGP